MKVAELKPGMLLRFKEERIYKFLIDRNHEERPQLTWFDFGKIDPTRRLYGFKVGRPLMIYLGMEKQSDATYHGSFKKVRKVLVEGQVAAVFPEAWKYVDLA